MNGKGQAPSLLRCGDSGLVLQSLRAARAPHRDRTGPRAAEPERGRCGRHWDPSAGKGRDLSRDLSAQLKLPTKTTRDITKDTPRGARLKENKSESPRPRTAVSLPTRSCPEFTVKRAGAEGAGG